MTDREKQLEEMLSKIVKANKLADLCRLQEDASNLLTEMNKGKERHPPVHEEEWEVDNSDEFPGIVEKPPAIGATTVVWVGHNSDYGGIRGQDENHAMQRAYLMAAAPKMKRALLVAHRFFTTNDITSRVAEDAIINALKETNPPTTEKNDD